jgi:hypothetical protein
MPAVLRLIVVALLMLALPLKGLAAVGALACPHGAGWVAAMVAQAPADAPPCHEAESDSESASLPHVCTACAPCCAPALATLTTLDVPQLPSARDWVVLEPQGQPAHAFERLDRPPRSFLA